MRFSAVHKASYGVLYGGLVAGIYFFVRLRGASGGLELFALASASIFTLHLLLWPKQTLQGFFDKTMCLRSFLFAITQVLILKAQAHGHTSTALVASTMGSVFGVLLGRLLLKEKINGLGLIAAAFCFTAVFSNPQLLLQSGWGALGGLIQGAGFVLARSLMLSNKSIKQSVATGFGISMIVGFSALALESGLHLALQVNLEALLLTTVAAIVVQYGFFHLYKAFDSQRASLLLLSRLPWALVLEHYFLGRAIDSSQIFVSLSVAIGAALLILESV